MKTNNRFCAVSLLAGFCLVVTAACGSDDDDDSAPAGEGGAAGSSAGAAGTSGVTPVDLCPEIVAADCAALRELVGTVEQCEYGLPMLGGLCATEMDALLACTGPDPVVTCDPAGIPIIEGCTTEWNAVWACGQQLMPPPAGGAGGGAGAPGTAGSPAGGSGGAAGGS